MAGVRAARGSDVVPTITSLRDSAGNELLVPGELREKKSSALLRSKSPLAGGDYTLTLAARGEGRGDAEWTVALKSPRAYAFELPELVADGR